MTTKGSTGLDTKTAAALSYVFPVLSGLLFLIVEKDEYVRFHAMQAIVVFTGLFILDEIFKITVVFSSMGQLIGIIGFVLWLVLIYKAWQGEKWEVIFFGKIANQLLGKK